MISSRGADAKNVVEWRSNELSVGRTAGLREAVWRGKRGICLVARAAVSPEVATCQ
jgi:hypothetical protein